MATVKYSGPVASFHCPTEATIRSLKVHFSPKQLGSGTPSPENVRPIEGWDGVTIYHADEIVEFPPSNYQRVKYICGINGAVFYIDPVSILKNQTIEVDTIFQLGASNDTQDWIIGDGIQKDLSQFEIGWYNGSFYRPGGSKFTINYLSGVGRNALTHIIMSRVYGNDTILNWGVFQRAGGYPLHTNEHFIYSMALKIDNILIHNLIPCRRKSDNKPGMYDTVSGEFFINQGTGEFVCGPDVGETIDYEFGVLGKNKLNVGTIQFNHYKQYRLNDNPIPPGTYTLSANVVSNDTDADKSYVLFRSGSSSMLIEDGATLVRDVRDSKTVTFRNPITEITFYAGTKYADSTGDTATWSDVQLELGSTATAYEPYDPNKTVYGGWVDLITGEVVRDWLLNTHTIAATDGTPGGAGTGGDTNYRFIAWNLASAHLPDNDRKGQAVCDIVPQSNQTGDLRFWLGGGTAYMILPNDNNEYSATIAYAERDLNTTIYRLPPHSSELKTFLAQNNIWSNADYVEVEYDLHETQNILARKQFIIASQPHIEKLAAAPLQSFETDMAAPLKECKVYFNPVQEGSGDPSPDNVRAIMGWDKLEIYKTGKNLVDHQKIPDCFLPEIPYTIDGDYLHINYEYIRGYPDNTYMYLPAGTYTTSIVKISGEKDVSADIRVSLNGQSWYGWAAPNYPTKQLPSGTNISTRLKGVGSTAAFQIEVGSISTNFEPYNGITIPITFPSEAGTIYGGYVDLISGELVQTYYTQELNNISRSNNNYDAEDSVYLEWSSTYPYIREYSNGIIATGPAVGARPKNGFCNLLQIKAVDNWRETNQINTLSSAYLANRFGARMDINLFGVTSSDSFSTINAAINNYLTEHPIKVTYMLQTPITYQLTPTQLKSLRGTNNIWSNANGNIELSYWKH